MQQEDLDCFMSDPELTDMMEQVKVSDDIFDVIDLNENQHSDMLAWCLNPNEGHAQGDAVIKDFLVAASNAAHECTFSNRKFFDYWTPSKIRTASFGSAFASREFTVEIEVQGRKGRLDLFLVDPQNKFLIAIENKAGRRLTRDQLDGYCEAVKVQIAGRRAFSDYSVAYVVIDRELQTYSDEHISELGTRWALLDYSWLRSAADRARHQVARNNGAAQLLMAYCQAQSDWEKPVHKRLNELAASLTTKHESVMTELASIRRLELSEWTPRMFEEPRGDLLHFYRQNRGMCDTLLEIRGIAAVAAQLKSALPAYASDSFDVQRVWLAVPPLRIQHLVADAADEDPWWPLFVSVRQERADGDEQTTYAVRLVWLNEHFGSHVDTKKLREAFAVDFPGLKKLESRRMRRIIIGRNLRFEAAVRAAAQAVNQMNDLLVRALPND